MDQKIMEKLVKKMLEIGVEYSEVYYEDTISKNYHYINKKIDNININTRRGVGLRVINDDKYYYYSTNNFNEEALLHMIDILKDEVNIKEVEIEEDFTFTEVRENVPKIKKEHAKMSTKDKLDYLQKVDTIARNYSPLINQVEVNLIEYDYDKKIGNSERILAKNREVRTRLFITIYARDQEKNASVSTRIDNSLGYEILDEIDLEKKVLNACQEAIEELDACYFEGGEYPVVIGNGFGAVIFHEACGHALEATSVAIDKSILSDKFQEKIASNKVTLIDDGTLEGIWGSSIIDDEAEYAQKNILIEKGVLKQYLVDRLHDKKMSNTHNGSSRRGTYMYAPTSRMSNTYIASGNDKIEDMIKSIDYGVYVKGISNGTVVPATGDFNFYTSGVYMIRKGKICEKVKDVSLIGNCLDILNNIEMVADDLKLEGGFCGSVSGFIPVTVGQPTIKVSKILIGGKNND